MKQEVLIGQTNYTVGVLVRDDAGNAKTGLVFGDIDLAYARFETDNDVTTTDVAPANLATPALDDPHLDWGFLEISAGDHPGLYRLDCADEVFAANAWSAIVSLTGAGLEPSHLEFILTTEAPISRVVPPSVAQMNARTIVSGDYTVVGDLGTVQSGDSFAIVNGVHGLVSIQDDIDTLITRLTAARAGNLDELAAANLPADIDTLLTRLTAARAAFLDASISSRGTADPGDAMTLTGAAVDAILDEAVEGTITLRQAQRVLLAYLAGETNGGGTVTINFRDQADTINRITMTVDADGDRSATVLNLA